MNERIDELFGKALDEAVPETWTTLNPAQLSRLKEKFAELIIQDITDTALIQARWYQLEVKDNAAVVALCDLVRDIREEYGIKDERTN